jgi:arylformamidase
VTKSAPPTSTLGLTGADALRTAASCETLQKIDGEVSHGSATDVRVYAAVCFIAARRFPLSLCRDGNPHPRSGMTLYDISVTLSRHLPVWPGEEAFHLETVRSFDRGDDLTVSRMGMGIHTGTHIDAPLHSVSGGASLESISLEKLVGRAVVARIDVADEITPNVLAALDLPPTTRRVLFRTRNSEIWRRGERSFVENYVALTSDAAAWIVERGIEVVGIDYLSIQLFRDTKPTTHTTLLEAGVVILEGLDLGTVAAGDYRLICLPLKIAGAEGAPARIILEEIEE